jgi:hypothetical protein
MKMSRNAKLDLAKRQAVGIVRPIARFAVGTARDVPVVELLKDRRALEAEKPCFNHAKPAPFDVTGHTVVTCAAAYARGSHYLNHKGSRATPQSRGHMNSFGYKTKAPNYAEPKWVPAGIQTLIPRAV